MLHVLHQYVGIAEGIFGIFCAAAGIPAGWLADRMRRDRTLRLCGFVMLGARQKQSYGLGSSFAPNPGDTDHEHKSENRCSTGAASRAASQCGALLLQPPLQPHQRRCFCRRTR